MNKLTPLDLALWAALPMAHTSQIEGRLTLILDSKRRRALPRRALVFGVALTAAALVPLAMLRPDAKARNLPETAASQVVNGVLVQLEGVTNGNHSGGHWWSLNGRPLPQDVYNTATFADGTRLDELQMKLVTFSFRVPQAQEQANVVFEAPGSSATGVCHDSGNGRWILNAAYPQPTRVALLRVGTASGVWTTEASNPSPTLSSGSGHNGQSVIFGPAASAPDGLCSVTITTDNMKQDVRFVAVDKQWQQHVISGSSLDIGSMTQRTLQISFPLSQLKEVRVETRPFVWIEFKSVALQPVQDERATATASAPVPEMTPWSGEMNYEDWKVARTYRLIFHTAPSVSGTRPEPPVGGRLVSGPGRVANVIIKPWKPGKSNILTVQYDYTPKITDKVHPDVIELLTKDGTVATVITQQPHQSQMVKP